ncbi:hypothetical protein RFI_08119 [Reticulomyxa filosa]|uniref:Purple acid phosphatase C-terminal domain-containing protein n=1 Tax=Reticulomyxa filosa TaxID=46433 RepID=X6NSU1_RETFI|nr:hypothetical protein RFI_08119 [Reticulomyxa filosa]|eukprot:ETO29008.1 hypothetical protein RFI_08119 [Reticulomyxa filosa]
MSTEHDFTQGSTQYKYIVNILESTNRTTFPWIFFTGHRPMYVDSTFDGDVTLSQFMVDQLEPLFKQYKISVGMWGHAHQYGRTCPVYAETCYSAGEAPIHIVYGMADFVESDHTHYGFMHFTVLNSTHCYTKFVNSANGDVLDIFLLYLHLLSLWKEFISFKYDSVIVIVRNCANRFSANNKYFFRGFHNTINEKSYSNLISCFFVCSTKF